MSKAKPLLAGVEGMNNRINPKRLPVDPETFVGLAAEIVDMRVGETGDVSLDYGNTLVRAGNYHSKYCNNSACYVGGDGKIYQFLEDETEREVVYSATGEGVTGLTGSRISYEKLGKLVFFSDTVSKIGILRGHFCDEWRKQKYLRDTDREFSGPPVPRHMAMLNARMYMVPADEPTTIIWSERGQVGLYNRLECVRAFESEIKMIAAVKQGLFVSTSHETFFIRIAGSAQSPDVDPCEPYPVAEWSLAHRRYKCRKMGLDLPGYCRFWRSKSGACVGTDQGEFFNMTESNILLPDKCNTTGASLVIGNYLYHVSQ